MSSKLSKFFGNPELIRLKKHSDPSDEHNPLTKMIPGMGFPFLGSDSNLHKNVTFASVDGQLIGANPDIAS